jgi:hypothetical protein
MTQAGHNSNIPPMPAPTCGRPLLQRRSYRAAGADECMSDSGKLLDRSECLQLDQRVSGDVVSIFVRGLLCGG